ncbi:glutamate racemase [Pantoea sp.]|uniref:glutamate racemase n=1 Tax=Pantoea TaxID=53335 RepID=UPI003917CD79
MNLLCLHTAASNIAIFDDAAASLGVTARPLNHLVMPEWLAEAERSGGMSVELRARIARLIEALLPQMEAIVMTCSTLAPVADDFAVAGQPGWVLRSDKMLAEALQRYKGPSVALCAAESTLEATRALFCRAGGEVEVRLVAGAWAAFKAGDNARYFALIADAAEQAYQQGAGQVALAQSSMTPVAQRFAVSQRPLTAPHLALQACYALR